MKNKVLIFLIFISLSNFTYSQVLKLYNGVSISSNNNELGLLNEKFCSYYGTIGIDYLLHDYYFLSSQVGYLGKGGRDRISIFSPSSDSPSYYNVRTKWNYIHMNTTFRLKLQSQRLYPYFGIGPKMDILIGSSYVKTKEGYDLKLNPISVGGIIELGIVRRLEKLDIGINTSYSFNFNEIGNSKNGNLDNYSYKISGHTFLITLSLGYVIRKNKRE